MKHVSWLAFLCLGLFAAGARAGIVIGGSASVVITPRGTATTLSGSSGTVLGTANGTDLLEYQPGLSSSAEKTMTLSTWNCLLGDEDGDGDHFEEFFGVIDAVELPRFPRPPFILFTPATPYEYVFSTSESFGGSTSTLDQGPRGAADGSLFRVRPGWVSGDFVQIWMSEQQILSAIGQTNPVDDIDVDAFAQDSLGNVFLSFEDDELVQGNPTTDGSLVVIPASALTYAPNGTISAVTAGSAVVALDEVAFDTMVVNAGLVTTSRIEDLTALSIDPAGGSFLGQDGGTWPDLIFAGADPGPALFTTAGGSGAFVNINALALGSPTPNANDLGLGTGSGVEALAVYDARPPELSMDVFDGEVVYPGEVHAEWSMGNATPNSIIFLLVSYSSGAPGAQPTSLPIYGLTYPAFFPYPLHPNLVIPVSTDGLGIGTFGADIWHSISGFVVVTQGFDPNTNQLGAPGAMWFP